VDISPKVSLLSSHQ